MHIEGLNGNVSAKIDPNSISLFGSVNMFDSENTERPQPKKETQKTKIGSKYIDDEKYRKEIQGINTPIISSGANSKLHNDIISKIQQQQNTKIKATKPKFKIKDLNKSTIDKFNKFGSISSDTYVPNNLSQSMMMFPNNNKAKKGTDKTMKFENPQTLNQSTIKFGNYGSIGDKTYKTNNLSQSMMMFPNNHKAEKGTNKTKKIDLKKNK